MAPPTWARVATTFWQPFWCIRFSFYLELFVLCPCLHGWGSMGVKDFVHCKPVSYCFYCQITHGSPPIVLALTRAISGLKLLPGAITNNINMTSGSLPCNIPTQQGARDFCSHEPNNTSPHVLPLTFPKPIYWASTVYGSTSGPVSEWSRPG